MITRRLKHGRLCVHQNKMCLIMYLAHNCSYSLCMYSHERKFLWMVKGLHVCHHFYTFFPPICTQWFLKRIGVFLNRKYFKKTALLIIIMCYTGRSGVSVVYYYCFNSMYFGFFLKYLSCNTFMLTNRLDSIILQH